MYKKRAKMFRFVGFLLLLFFLRLSEMRYKLGRAAGGGGAGGAGGMGGICRLRRGPIDFAA